VWLEPSILTSLRIQTAYLKHRSQVIYCKTVAFAAGIIGVMNRELCIILETCLLLLILLYWLTTLCGSSSPPWFHNNKFFRDGVVSPTPTSQPGGPQTTPHLAPNLRPVWHAWLYQELTLPPAYLSWSLGFADLLTFFIFTFT
jgi:hypothetical protein